MDHFICPTNDDARPPITSNPRPPVVPSSSVRWDGRGPGARRAKRHTEPVWRYDWRCRVITHHKGSRSPFCRYKPPNGNGDPSNKSLPNTKTENASFALGHLVRISSAQRAGDSCFRGPLMQSTCVLAKKHEKPAVKSVSRLPKFCVCVCVNI